MFPIKYIDNNLVWNKDNEVFAYYELITLIVTVAFSISSMFYNISTDYPFFMVAFLQIV